MQMQDLITIALILLALWTFIPRHVRRAARSGLAPFLSVLLDTIHDAARVARSGLAHAAYRGLLGVPIPDAVLAPRIENELVDAEPDVGDFPLPAAIEPQMEPRTEPQELVLNATEVIAVARMIGHNKSAAKPSKSSTIAAGFGVSRGGSAAYQRASVIYDALFGPPPPAIVYRDRTPEQEALRKHLHLSK